MCTYVIQCMISVYIDSTRNVYVNSSRGKQSVVMTFFFLFKVTTHNKSCQGNTYNRGCKTLQKDFVVASY